MLDGVQWVLTRGRAACFTLRARSRYRNRVLRSSDARNEPYGWMRAPRPWLPRSHGQTWRRKGEETDVGSRSLGANASVPLAEGIALASNGVVTLLLLKSDGSALDHGRRQENGRNR